MNGILGPGLFQQPVRAAGLGKWGCWPSAVSSCQGPPAASIARVPVDLRVARCARQQRAFSLSTEGEAADVLSSTSCASRTTSRCRLFSVQIPQKTPSVELLTPVNPPALFFAAARSGLKAATLLRLCFLPRVFHRVCLTASYSVSMPSLLLVLR